MTTSAGPGGFFFAAGTEVSVQQLPRWNSPMVLGQTGGGTTVFVSTSSHDPVVTGAGPIFTIGHAFRDGALPSWLGNRPRLGVVGGFVSSSGHTRLDYPYDNGRILAPRNLAGGSTGFVVFTNVQPIFEELRTFRESWNVGLRAASDFPVAPNLVFTPQITFYGGQTTDTYNWHLIWGSFGVLHSVNERIRNREIGGDFAAALTWHALRWLSFNVTGRVGAVSLSSDMRGSDCYHAGTCIPGSPQSQTVTDSRSAISLRAGGSLGANLDLGYALLSMSGFVTYDSKIPGIVNPTFTSFPPAQQPPARLYFDNGFRYGGMLNLRFLLPVGL